MKKEIQAIVTCLAGLASAIALTAAEPAKQTDSADGSITVRALSFKPSDRNFALKFGGKSKVTTMADAAAVERLFGKEFSKELMRLADFTKEQIVLVSWTTAGPPEGVLKHEVKGKEGEEPQLVFYVQGPKGAGIRGMRARIGAEFFAVPKDIAVAFDAVERR
jgi:hypothetical protein